MPEETLINLRVPRSARVRTRPTFNARPVCAAGRANRSATGPYSTHYTATASALYITRQAGEDRFGPVPEGYLVKNDLVSTGRYHPTQSFPAALREGLQLWRDADGAAAQGGPTEVSATHIVASLPANEPERWDVLVKTYSLQVLVERGMIADWAIHAKAADDGSWVTMPHVHILATARFWRANIRKGDRQKAWLASRSQLDAAEAEWLRITGLPPVMPVITRPTAPALAA